MNKLLIIILAGFITLSVSGQRVYSPSKDGIPGRNAPIGMSGGLPLESRSMYHDTTAFPDIWRDFQNNTEVLGYFNTAIKRKGGFIIWVHNGGTIVSRDWVGGTRTAYIWKDGTADSDLVPFSGSGGTTSIDNTLRYTNNILSVVPNNLQTMNIYSPGPARAIDLTQTGYFIPYTKPRLYAPDWTSALGTPYVRFTADCYTGSIGDTMELTVLDAADGGYVTGGTAIVQALAGAAYYTATDANSYGPSLFVDSSAVLSTGNSVAGSAFGKSITLGGNTGTTFQNTTGLYANNTGSLDTAGTVECFFRLGRLGVSENLVAKWGLGGPGFGQYLLYKDANNKLALAYQTQDSVNHTLAGTTTLSLGVTYHAAFSFGSGRAKLWLNGNLEAQQTPSVFLTLNTSSPAEFTIGKNNPATTPPYAFQGSIDEVRVSNTDRYLTTFTAPATPFTNDYYTTLLYHMDQIAVINPYVSKVFTPFIALPLTSPLFTQVRIRNQNGNRGQLYNVKMEIKYQ